VGTRVPLPLEKTGGGPNDRLSIEFTGLRAINVENFAGRKNDGGDGKGTDVRKVDLVDSLQSHLGSGAKVRTTKELRNVGASMSYKLRDASGQAREYNNYMAPIDLDGQRVMLAGVRENPSDSFNYLRIPVDDQDGIDSWVRLRQALQNAGMREEAARRYVRNATPADKPEMGPQLDLMARRTLGLFSGAELARPGADEVAGLPALSMYLETNVPAAERNRISELLLRVLSGSLFEMLNATREEAGLAPMANDATTQNFMTQALLSLSDSFFYPAPVLLELTDFKQVQASVFQVARAPGKKLVYLGCVCLIIGVFAMLYIRERRLWIWLQPTSGPHGTHVSTAMSTTRRTLDADAEFEALKKAILKEAAA
jgi:cytochrome c biogenesis protein